MLRIDEPLPADPLESEVVLHLRRQLRRVLRGRGPAAPSALALLFGFPPAEGAHEAWQTAAAAPDWLQTGAAVAAHGRDVRDGVIPLGYDADHVAQCREWLRARKDQDEAFRQIVTTDLATLLEISKARDLAVAEGIDDDGKPRTLPIMIQGPTGSGKELLANAIHEVWKTARQHEQAPFQVVHVAGMTTELINDELFGHVKGAFTDAKWDRPGRLEAADGGTLLIDEVGDLPPAAQLRLLRFLQTQRVSRVGENRERKLSVRVIAATWHDLDKDVAEGHFREDLLYRLRVGSGLVLRAVVEREGIFDDVVQELLRRRGHRAQPPITRSARDALALHEWRGNLRELVGVLESAVSLADGETLRVEHLPPHLQRRYLAEPLHARAVGFLCDELDGQPLTEELARWRVAQVSQSLMALPPPSANSELGQIGEFLMLLDDPSPAHQHSVQKLRELLKIDQEGRRQGEFADAWAKIAAAGLPPLVASAVKETERQARIQAHELETRRQRLEGGVQLEQNPWLQLFREIRGLPLLRQADSGDIAKFFLGAYNLCRLIAPTVIDRIREDFQTGGIEKVRGRVMAFLAEDEDETADVEGEEPDELPPKRPARSLSREDWVNLTKHYGTLAEARYETGYDPKTIARYLRKHEIANPWSRPE